MNHGVRGAGASVPSEDLVPGRYRLTKLLARGGMGEVHLAQDLRLRRQVAIKLVKDGTVADADARRRLLREAQAAATLDHPYVCAVYDFGETVDGRAYFVMPFVEGQTLSAVFEKRELSPARVLSMVVQIGEALAAAHRHGLVHRDVKPSNVIVTPSGSPKLLDLGISKVVAWSSDSSDGSTLSAATTEGTLVGTPAYMSPEQVQLRPLDGRTDVFSLGAVLYEGLTGRRAFQGQSSIETIASVLHVHPPAPSTLRPELTSRYDALCERLLAKDRADRFQTAEEAVAAMRQLLADPASPPKLDAHVTTRSRWRRSSNWVAMAGLLLLGFLGVWLWNSSHGLPSVPDEANRWYTRGTEAIREGAYVSGRTALEQSIALFPKHVLAYARLAEADAELDDERSAQARLVHVASLVPDESRLPYIERLRLRAVRAHVLRDVDASVAAYRELVTRRPQEAGAWLDLGRAQEAGGLRTDAKSSYEQAILRDRQYAVAYLRLGSASGQESKRDDALAAFAEAERLYRAASEVEGETEVLIRRGRMLDAFGDLPAARSNLERGLALAVNSNRTYQQVRTRVALSSVTASEGQFAEAERLASTAVQEALANGIETVAADGLVDLAAIMQSDRPKEAAAHLEQALKLAERRGARRTIGRVRMQQAVLLETDGRPRDSLVLINEVLPFWKANRYRSYELQSLSIAARAHGALDELELAQRMSRDVLSIATSVKDEAQQALAASNLASVTTALGQYPDALHLRDQVVEIHRRQGDKATLPYDLANRADLLIRLGRGKEADAALSELDAGIAAGLAAYVGRARRLAFLRALSAAIALNCGETLRFVRQVSTFGQSTESAAVLAPGVEAFCKAQRAEHSSKAGTAAPETEPTLAREMQYWRAAAALVRQDYDTALFEATRGLSLLGTRTNDELRWRLAAVASGAARHLRNATLAEEMSATARAALGRIKSAWKEDFVSYEQRSDLVDLKKRSGLL